jgi:hypothetical protein
MTFTRACWALEFIHRVTARTQCALAVVVRGEPADRAEVMSDSYEEAAFAD